MNFIHAYYRFLRFVGLRARAQAKLVKEGDMFVIKIDKLDPGEGVSIEGEFEISSRGMREVKHEK